MRLIDADYLKQMFDTACGTNREVFNVADAVYKFVIKIIDDAPTVDDKNETMSNRVFCVLSTKKRINHCPHCKHIAYMVGGFKRFTLFTILTHLLPPHNNILFPTTHKNNKAFYFLEYRHIYNHRIMLL